MKLKDLRALVPLTRLRPPHTNGHHPDEPESLIVSFDARDGKRRVLIVVDGEGAFEPVQYYGVRGANGDQGLHEAATIAAHGALMCAQRSWAHAAAQDGAP